MDEHFHFFALFLLNHFVFIPQFIAKKRKTLYVVCCIAALGLFTSVQVVCEHHFRPAPPPMPKEHPMPPRHHHPNTFPLKPQHMAHLIMAMLMLGADLGAVAGLNSRKMRQRLAQLEKQSLQQELEHLRYQINPHFFMNTLNNIHALVDIDHEQAKRAIVELSGLMRYVLYEGNGTLVPLDREVKFLRHYISLMKMRYSDDVEVTYEVPDPVPAEIMLPPLLIGSFVENAFKHGISYLQPSFIHVKLTATDGHIRFECVNSRHGAVTKDGQHGIGLENVRKRLDLQYADKYQLKINDSDENTFAITLILPYD